MFWITKYRHNEIVKQYQEAIEDLKESLNRKDLIVEILDRITNKETSPYLTLTTDMGYVTSRDIMSCLDDTVPRYVDDYFGGKVIKQEATPVTILDADGKATYSQTAQKPDKGRRYVLVDLSK